MTSGLAVDIENEFARLLNEASLLARSLDTLGSAETPDDALRWVQTAGIAAGVEKVYSGCERIMLLLAKRIDGAPLDKAEGWHATLLNRMANPFPDIRGPIISLSCKSALDRLRGFRHRIRNSYGLGLDEEIVFERARELAAAVEVFHAEVTASVAALAPRD